MKARVLMLICVLELPVMAQMNVNGRMEVAYVDAQDGSPVSESGNLLNKGHPTFLWRFRGYLDMPVSEKSYVFADFRWQPDGLHLDYAAIRYFLNKSQTIGFQAGILGTFIGNVTPRRSSKYNPMLQLPLMYDYFTTLSSDPDITFTELHDNRGRGSGLRIFNLGVYSPGFEVFANFANVVDVNVGIFNSSPSNPYMVNSAKSLNSAFRLGVRPIMGMNLGVSYGTGPYVVDSYGQVSMQANQTLYDIDASFERGYFSFFSEAVWNTWEAVHITQDLRVFSYYVEARYKLHPRLFIAGRYAQMKFDDLEFPMDSEIHPWDDPVTRYEMSLGYYAARATLAKIVIQINETQRIDPSDNYVALQFSAGF